MLLDFSQYRVLSAIISELEGSYLLPYALMEDNIGLEVLTSCLEQDILTASNGDTELLYILLAGEFGEYNYLKTLSCVVRRNMVELTQFDQDKLRKLELVESTILHFMAIIDRIRIMYRC